MKASKTAALRRERREVAAIEKKDSLRRKLLIALAAGPSTPTALSKEVGARKESVSRKLAELRKEGLIAVEKNPDDRRQSWHALTAEGDALTAEGRVQLGRHLAFGARTKAPSPPDREEAVAFLREALAGAVAMRRRTNRLQDAIDRLEEIHVRAVEIGASEVALEVLAELATTQRQDRQYEAHARSLTTLDKIALGLPDAEPELVFPAIAHLEYERGRSGELGEEHAWAKARHLTAAISLFGQLTEHRPKSDTRSWRARQAWSAVSLAGNLRQQSQYEESLRYAASSLQMFNDLDDHYGRTQCWFLFGFCLRQLRRFDEAWSCLQEAHDIAADPRNSFERARSSCLMQMGEVKRCQGEAAEARELLGTAFDLAGNMDLLVTQAFAMSALGATHSQEKNFDLAQNTLEQAQGIFARSGHQEGIALNARRQATVARRLSLLGQKPNTREVKALLNQAEEIYKSLGSPAGIAACDVERGWMRKHSPDCGKLETVVGRLNQMLGIGALRRSLERDAWVPGVINSFAKEIGDELERKANELYSNARRKLKDHGDEGVERVSEVAGEIRSEHERRPGPLTIEMGGESRRTSEPLALTAA